MVLQLILAVEEKAPDAEDVVAGWGGFTVFVLLILAVAFLGWSLIKQLKKADRAADQGLFDPSPKKPRRPMIGDSDTDRDNQA